MFCFAFVLLDYAAEGEHEATSGLDEAAEEEILEDDGGYIYRDEHGNAVNIVSDPPGSSVPAAHEEDEEDEDEELVPWFAEEADIIDEELDTVESEEEVAT